MHLGNEALDGADGEKKKVLLSGHSVLSYGLLRKVKYCRTTKKWVMWKEAYPEFYAIASIPIAENVGTRGTDVTTRLCL